MTWVTWRQSRIELLIFLAAVASVMTFVIWTGLDIRSKYDGLDSAGCLISGDQSESCSQLILGFVDHVQGLRNLSIWLNFVPLLLGILLAAPLVLDLEQGTYRLAWTQGVSRARWFVLKVALGMAALIAATLTLFALWVWWDRPLLTTDRFDMFERLDGDFFNNGGPVLVAYAVFAFALCLAVGAILRRSIAAFGISLVGFTAIRILVETKLRLNYLSPMKTISDSVDPRPSVEPGAFVIESGPSDQYGNLLHWNDPLVQECFMRGEIRPKEGISTPDPEQVRAGMEATSRCMKDHDIFMTTVYHPGDRFWIFQGIESAIFLGMAAVLLGITFYWVTRRIAR